MYVVSSYLFNYINDLADEIKALGLGLGADCGDNMISLLMYADDVVFIAHSARNLQFMLDCLDKWCRRWRLRVNPEKTQIIHFRPSQKKEPCTNYLCVAARHFC